MQQTEVLKLNLIEGSDTVDPGSINENFLMVEEELEKLSTAVGSGGKTCRIAWGNYTGNNTYGESDKTELSFPFTPLMVVVYPSDNSLAAATLLSGCTQSLFGTNYCTVSWSDNSVHWYSTASAYYQFNLSSTSYLYVAMGY